jgi:hypothetical protein
MTNKLAMHNDIEMDAPQLGGGGFSLLESNVYDFVIDIAFLFVTKADSQALNLHLRAPDKTIHKFQFWMVSGKQKGNLNYYTDKNGKKHYLPGFINADSLAVFATGKHIGELDTSNKMIKLWNREVQKEVPTEVPVFMDLIGKPVKMAVIKQIVDQTQENKTTNKYELVGKTKEENDVMAVFNPTSGFTMDEATNGLATPEFITKWTEKWKGKTRNKESKANKALREKLAKQGSPSSEADTSQAPLWG